MGFKTGDKIRCTDAKTRGGHAYLTLGKYYDVLGCDLNGDVKIKDDSCDIRIYSSDRFVLVANKENKPRYPRRWKGVGGGYFEVAAPGATPTFTNGSVVRNSVGAGVDTEYELEKNREEIFDHHQPEFQPEPKASGADLYQEARRLLENAGWEWDGEAKLWRAKKEFKDFEVVDLRLELATAFCDAEKQKQIAMDWEARARRLYDRPYFQCEEELDEIANLLDVPGENWWPDGGLREPGAVIQAVRRRILGEEK